MAEGWKRVIGKALLRRAWGDWKKVIGGRDWNQAEKRHWVTEMKTNKEK